LVDFVHCRDAVLLRIILISKILPAMPTRAAPSMEPDPTVEEFDLPCGEAVLAGTLALMTGYSQALQAEHDPAQRLVISLRIAQNLDRLADQAALSAPFRALSGKLAALWQQIARCTADAGADCVENAAPQHSPGRSERVLH
jgi:hypothetical protein